MFVYTHLCMMQKWCANMAIFVEMVGQYGHFQPLIYIFEEVMNKYKYVNERKAVAQVAIRLLPGVSLLVSPKLVI